MGQTKTAVVDALHAILAETEKMNHMLDAGDLTPFDRDWLQRHLPELHEKAERMLCSLTEQPLDGWSESPWKPLVDQLEAAVNSGEVKPGGTLEITFPNRSKDPK